MSDLSRLKISISECNIKRYAGGYPQACWFTTPKIIQKFSKKELLVKINAIH